MRLSKAKAAIISLIFINVIWGASFPIFKWSLEGISPLSLAFMRFLLASLLILPLSIHKLKIHLSDVPVMILLSLLGFSINISLLFLGLQSSSSINAVIIGSSGPIFLLLGAMIFFKERPRHRVFYGTLLSLIGILTLILRPILEHGIHKSITGNLLILISTLSLVAYTMLLKKFSDRYHPLTLTFWTFAIAAITLAPFAFFEGQGTEFVTQLNAHSIVGILYGAVFSSSIAYLLYAIAIKYINMNEIGVFLYVDPVVAVLIAIPLLGEVITFSYILGTLFVFLGILIAEGRFHYHPFQKLKG